MHNLLGNFDLNEMAGQRKRIELGGNQVVQLVVVAKCRSEEPCAIDAAFLDADGTVLRTWRALTDASGKAEIYTLTPALTRYAEVGIGNAGGNEPEPIMIHEASFFRVDPSDFQHPEIDLDLYEMPLWEGDTVTDEAVLFFTEGGEAPSGELLYEPVRILALKSYSERKTYTESIDYTFNGRTLSLTPNSGIPFKKAGDYPGSPLYWYETPESHVLVTYEHAGKWAGPAVEYKGKRMPRTMRKLINWEPLNVVGYGDSITRGQNVSSNDKIPPYMPAWLDLFADIVRKRYDHQGLILHNAALPGARSEWGASEAEKHVTPLNPDLVIVAFGMNDFWSVDGTRFKAHIQTIIEKIRKANPDVEFLLVSSMMFDTGYANDGKYEYYRNNMLSYQSELYSLEDTGIQVYDMTALSEYLYSRKKPKDMLPNPLHPGDYLARWYGVGLAYTLIDQHSV